MNTQETLVRSVRVRISGMVQGVGFRYWTRNNAIELGLNGWVLNRYDGSVEALFSGTPENVGEMLQRCASGPRYAEVTEVRIMSEDAETADSFEIKREF